MFEEYECGKCGQVFDAFKELDNHIKLLHSDLRMKMNPIKQRKNKEKHLPFLEGQTMNDKIGGKDDLLDEFIEFTEHSHENYMDLEYIPYELINPGLRFSNTAEVDEVC
jgi:hypothetical protein